VAEVDRAEQEMRLIDGIFIVHLVPVAPRSQSVYECLWIVSGHHAELEVPVVTVLGMDLDLKLILRFPRVFWLHWDHFPSSPDIEGHSLTGRSVLHGRHILLLCFF
jgi:hypothetical protein